MLQVVPASKGAALPAANGPAAAPAAGKDDSSSEEEESEDEGESEEEDADMMGEWGVWLLGGAHLCKWPL